jgi:predicted PhzF superfamily epimerase YddE/YHI9
MAVYEDEGDVRTLAPDMGKLAAFEVTGIIATAPSEDCDFVSRFFAPAVGIPEDPVTGSAHCTLVPYWAERLGRSVLHARQVSSRGGELFCALRGDRVEIAGHAVQYLEGTIDVPA